MVDSRWAGFSRPGYINADVSTMRKRLEDFPERLDARLFTIWNVLLVIVASFSSFAIPFSLAAEESAQLFRRREIVLTSIYLIDILISVYRLQKRASVVHIEYSAMRSFFFRWIWLDILAALPLTAMFGLPWLQIVRLAKMVKVIYLLQILRRIQVNLANIVLIAQMIYWIAIATHWLACGWLDIRGFDHDLDMTTNYINALYWTSMTLTTVGFGDITPVSNIERLYAIATMFFGYSFFGYLIGSFASILTKRDPIREKYKQNMEKLINAARYANLPLDLQQQIHAYYQYQMNRRIGYDEESFINDLPASLRGEVSLHFRKEVIEGVTIFEDAPQEFILDIAQHLRERIVAPGECIFKAGDFGKEVFFIAHGTVNILDASEEHVYTTLGKGEFFGEIALFQDLPRSATARAKTYCDLYILNQHAFEEVFAGYPEIAARIQAKAAQRSKS